MVGPVASKGLSIRQRRPAICPELSEIDSHHRESLVPFAGKDERARVAVVGGTGLAGRYVVEALRRSGHDAVAIARWMGVDVITGAGLAEALAGVDSVVDVLNLRAAAPTRLDRGSGRRRRGSSLPSKKPVSGTTSSSRSSGSTGCKETPTMRASAARRYSRWQGRCR
jgi:hypothetical protein